MKPQALQLFPTTIWVLDLGELAPSFADWQARLDAQRAREAQSQGRSTRLGWSGPKTLFDDPAFAALRSRSHEAFGHALQAMGLPAGLPFALEAWGNIHERGGHNQPHIHREAMLSGCFYLQTPPGSGAIVFNDPRPGTLYSRPWGQGVNRWERRAIQPKAGMLLLFPHWLEHAVEPHAGELPRLSIAINAVLPARPAPAPGG